MFARTVRTLAVSALIAIGAAAATTAPATAGGLQVGIQIGGPGYGGYNPYWKPHYGTCKPYKAVNKAHYYGVRKSYVSFANRRKVVVKGWKRGRPAKVVFANSWACPVLAVY